MRYREGLLSRLLPDCPGMLATGKGSRRLVPGLSRFYDPACLVELQGELYLCLIQRGECSVNLHARNFLQVIPSGVPLFSQELGKDAPALPEYKGSLTRAGRDAAYPGKLRPLQFLKNVPCGLILPDRHWHPCRAAGNHPSLDQSGHCRCRRVHRAACLWSRNNGSRLCGKGRPPVAKSQVP